jgi:hypothetical protein
MHICSMEGWLNIYQTPTQRMKQAHSVDSQSSTLDNILPSLNSSITMRPIGSLPTVMSKKTLGFVCEAIAESGLCFQSLCSTQESERVFLKECCSLKWDELTKGERVGEGEYPSVQ